MNDSSQSVDGAGMISLDPACLEPKGKDFHLASISPAIHVALCSSAPATDFDGEARPSNETDEADGAASGPIEPSATGVILAL